MMEANIPSAKFIQPVSYIRRKRKDTCDKGAQ